MVPGFVQLGEGVLYWSKGAVRLNQLRLQNCPPPGVTGAITAGVQARSPVEVGNGNAAWYKTS